MCPYKISQTFLVRFYAKKHVLDKTGIGVSLKSLEF